MNPLLARISINPQVCFGKPCIRGTRIVLAAIACGAEASRERIIPVPQAA